MAGTPFLLFFERPTPYINSYVHMPAAGQFGFYYITGKKEGHSMGSLCKFAIKSGNAVLLPLSSGHRQTDLVTLKGSINIST